MRIEHLECIIAIAKTGSINKASKILFTSPQNVSRLLKQLECEMGFLILDRESKKAVFTELGNEVLQLAEDTIKKIETIKHKNYENTIETTVITGDIFLLCIPNYDTYFFDNLISDFNMIFPHIRIHFLTKASQSHIWSEIEMEPQNKFGIVMFPNIDSNLDIPKELQDKFIFKPMYSGELICLVLNRSKFKEYQTISLQEIKNNKLVFVPDTISENSFILNTFRKYNISLENLNYITRTSFNFYNVINSGEYIGLVSRKKFTNDKTVTTKDIKPLAITEDTSFCTYLFYRINTELTAGQIEFIKYCEEHSQT